MTAEFLGIALILAVLAALLVAIPLWRYRRPDAAGLRASIAPVALVLALPLTVLAFYTQVTSYPWDNPERLTTPAGANAQIGVEQIMGMVSQLETRMATEPTVEGLVMLGRSYANLERMDDAVNAYHRAWEMTEGRDPAVSLGYAEALLLSDRNTLVTSAGDLIDGVLEQLPDNPKALWYGGMSSAARGRIPQAQQRLAHLLNQPDIPEQLRTVVQQQMAAMGAADPAARDADQTDAAATATGTQITISIAIDPNLVDAAANSTALFVIARETGQPGPPVAVKRIPSPALPLTVTLTDADSMMGNRPLSRIKNLALTARLSISGNATAVSGDLYGETQPEWPGESARILIDSRVP